MHRIQSSEDKMFAPVTALYESSFIPVERREYADHLLALSDSNFFMTAVTENSVSVGLMFYWESPEFIYLEHLAIMPDVREKGYGGKAVEQLKMLGKTVILEIEPPENGITETKRRRFYEKSRLRIQSVQSFTAALPRKRPRLLFKNHVLSECARRQRLR